MLHRQSRPEPLTRLSRSYGRIGRLPTKKKGPPTVPGAEPAGAFDGAGALACGEAAEPVRRELAARRAADEAAVRRRFARARADGDLPAGADPADLARFAVTVVRGMAVQAAGGASCEELRRVAAMALRAWPG